MTAFIDLVVKKHTVERFVLLTGGSVEKGGYYIGKLWKHLADIGVEYCVLRATWFMGALFLPHSRLVVNVFQLTGRSKTLLVVVASCHDQRQGKVYTACWDSKIQFVSADTKPHSTDYGVLRPELFDSR